MLVTKEDILKKTDGGLQVILLLFPEAQKSVARPNRKFKIRTTEKTASASLKNKNGTWLVTDFGGDGQPRNAIDCWMYENGCDFKTACREIAEQFGVNGTKANPKIKATYTKGEAKDQPNGITSKPLKTVPVEWLEVLGPHVTADHLDHLEWTPLESYTLVKDGLSHTYGSTSDYPILEIGAGESGKIYQPLNPDKKWRFVWRGKKPENHVFGLEQLRQDFEISKMATEDGEDPRLDSVIIASGDRDSLNVHSLGYNVVWFNSESELPSGQVMGELGKMCKQVYHLADLDATGKRQSHKLGLRFMDVRHIRLPKELTERKDHRGHPCKDVTDYVKNFKHHRFSDLIQDAYPYRFWDRRKSSKGSSMQFNGPHAIRFLGCCGFHRMDMANAKAGFVYVQVIGNVIKKVRTVDIRGYLIDFIHARHLPVDIVNCVYYTTKLSDQALDKLPRIDIDFTRGGPGYQIFHFAERVWKITSKEIVEHKTGELDSIVWDDQVIDPDIKGGLKHRVKLLDPPFQVARNEAGTYDIQISDDVHPFLQFLINTSRVHWKTEFQNAGLEESDWYKPTSWLKEQGLNRIDGEHLSDDEIQEQKMHLINKLHLIGYLLHTYKDPSRQWAPWIMDATISAGTESQGRSGKSITFDGLRRILKSAYENGRNSRLTEKAHLFENTTRHTDYLLIDDCHLYLDFNFFYSWITGDMPVNPKHATTYVIPFQDSPKICFTSNYAPRQRDSSTLGRLYFSVYSDFYHEVGDLYNRSRTPMEDLGIRIYDDFTPDQWNGYFNLMARCVQLTLSYGKINPPMANVHKRTYLNHMGDTFYRWANEFFFQEGCVTKLVGEDLLTKENALFTIRKKAMDALHIYSPRTKAMTTNNFTAKCESWARFHGLEFNPPQLLNSQNRMKHRIDGQEEECLVFVKTIRSGESEDLFSVENPDELPF